MAGKKRRPAWLDQFNRKPIERIYGGDDPKLVECAEKDALAVQYRRMVHLKEHFGIEGETGLRPWYRLALALASERNPAFTIVNPPWPRKGMSGGAGLLLLHHVAVVGEEVRHKKTGKLKREAVFEQLRAEAPDTYGKIKQGHLRKNFHAAERYHKKSTKGRGK